MTGSKENHIPINAQRVFLISLEECLPREGMVVNQRLVLKGSRAFYFCFLFILGLRASP